MLTGLPWRRLPCKIQGAPKIKGRILAALTVRATQKSFGHSGWVQRNTTVIPVTSGRAARSFLSPLAIHLSPESDSSAGFVG